MMYNFGINSITEWTKVDIDLIRDQWGLITTFAPAFKGTNPAGVIPSLNSDQSQGYMCFISSYKIPMTRKNKRMFRMAMEKYSYVSLAPYLVRDEDHYQSALRWWGHNATRNAKWLDDYRGIAYCTEIAGIRKTSRMFIHTFDKHALRTMPYEHYLLTTWWRDYRSIMFNHFDGKCQLCGSDDGLQLHHRTYENRGCENPIDLTVLCSSCHYKFHVTKFTNEKTARGD